MREHPSHQELKHHRDEAEAARVQQDMAAVRQRFEEERLFREELLAILAQLAQEREVAEEARLQNEEQRRLIAAVINRMQNLNAENEENGNEGNNVNEAPNDQN